MHWHPSRRLVVRLCGRMGPVAGPGVATIKSTGTRIQRTADRILRVYEPPVLARARLQVRTGLSAAITGSGSLFYSWCAPGGCGYVKALRRPYLHGHHAERQHERPIELTRPAMTSNCSAAVNFVFSSTAFSAASRNTAQASAIYASSSAVSLRWCPVAMSTDMSSSSANINCREVWPSRPM